MTMLDRMRRHRGWLKWSLGLVVLAMAVFFIPNDFLQPGVATGAASAREVIADVDGHELTAGDFQQRYLQQIQAYRNQFGGSINDQLLRQLGIEQQILTQMIDEQVALISRSRSSPFPGCRKTAASSASNATSSCCSRRTRR
jgi:hypothetical protein